MKFLGLVRSFLRGFTFDPCYVINLYKKGVFLMSKGEVGNGDQTELSAGEQSVKF